MLLNTLARLHNPVVLSKPKNDSSDIAVFSQVATVFKTLFLKINSTVI